MASSIRPCAVKKCETSSCAICHCCQKDLCLDHLKEHKDELSAKLIPLTNQINTSLDRLENLDLASWSSSIMLEQWRNAAHETIDRFYQNICYEVFEQTKSESLKKLHGIRSTLDQIIRKQGATRENIDQLNNNLRLIEVELDAVQNTPITLKPLVIDVQTIIQPDLLKKIQQRLPSIKDTTSDKDMISLQNGTAFQIFVQLPTDERTFITVKSSDTIIELKRKIHSKKGFPVNEQTLSCRGKILADHFNIAAYDIQRQSTINLVLAYRKSETAEIPYVP